MKIDKLIYTAAKYAAVFSILITFTAKAQNSVFGTVNGDVISTTEYQSALQNAIAELNARQIPIPNKSTLERQVANNLINEKLQLQAANEMGVVATENEIIASMTDVARTNNLSLDQLLEALEFQKIDVQQFRDRLSNQIRIRKLAQGRFYSSVRVTNQEVDNFIKSQNKEQYIYDFNILALVIPYGEGSYSQMEALDRAKQALKRANEGEDFKQLVAEYSLATNTFSGGELGIKNGSELSQAYFNSLQNTKKGELTSIIQDQGAFHILKLIDLVSPFQKSGEAIKEFRLSQIVISPDKMATGNPMPDELLKIEVNKIMQKISDGQSFESLARIYSSDESSKEKNGDLGWIQQPALDNQMQNLVNTLQLNQASQPIPINGSYHIFKLTDQRMVEDFSEIERSQAQEAVRRRKAEQEYSVWLQELRKNANINISGI